MFGDVLYEITKRCDQKNRNIYIKRNLCNGFVGKMESFSICYAAVVVFFFVIFFKSLFLSLLLLFFFFFLKNVCLCYLCVMYRSLLMSSRYIMIILNSSVTPKSENNRKQYKLLFVQNFYEFFLLYKIKMCAYHHFSKSNGWKLVNRCSGGCR